jgi:carbon-monoxide dehydrogenase medium subunit
VAASPGGERRIPASKFFTGLFETALTDDEIILAVEVPSQGPNQVSAIREVARRSGDYAMAGLAMSLTHEEGRAGAVRLVFFGVGETPVEAKAAAAALVAGADPAKAIPAAEAALDDDLDPTGDQQASPATKMHLSRVLLRRALSPFLAPEAAAA